MNLLNKKLIKVKNKNIKIEKMNNGIKITNKSNTHAFLMCPNIFAKSDFKIIRMDLYGKIIKGNGVILQVLDLKRNILSETSFNSTSNYTINANKFIYTIKVYGNTEVIIEKATIERLEEEKEDFSNIINSKNDMLIITPSYPTEENKYFGGFVHSRVKEYKKNGLNFDLVCAHEYVNNCTYNFEGIDVTRTNFFGLRKILISKKYKTILVHFFDYKYARVLDACDLSSTNLFFWIHGPETLYWEWSKMTDGYFKQESKLTNEQIKLFKENDKLIKRYNNYNNVNWVFVSEWIKEKSEELINIKFNNYNIIPNFIDEKTFIYNKKKSELRKKIFFIRRFDDINKYAIDINIRTILELSRRECFNDLEFNIYGTGQKYETLIEPIKNFENVHLHPEFLSHNQIAKVHQDNGIGLFATRYDAQGVSMCEAAMSGLAIVASDNDAIKEFIPNEENICDTEDYVKYANIIEKMYNDENLYQDLSEKCHNKVYEKCSYDETIKKEIDLLKKVKEIKTIVSLENKKSEKILSVIIPAYNVEKYLFHGVYTILNHKNMNKIEIIIVNDGSKDNTLKVAKELQKIFGNDNVNIIDKQNGGHGSTINVGLKVAKGKYVRIIDGDDWVDSEQMKLLIDKLEEEDCDIVLTDYCEDKAVYNWIIERKLYNFMYPFKEYKIEDLCYSGYGFNEWGPILATSNVKLSKIQNSFTLTEKSFYIDMEFDAYIVLNCDTIKYYPFDIYRYFIGREEQSISIESYKKNYQNHEKILFNLIELMGKAESYNKKIYIREKLVIPMLIAHYTILIQFLKSGEKYIDFENKLKKYPEIYFDTRIATKTKKFHRKTNGIFIKHNDFLKKIASKIF